MSKRTALGTTNGQRPRALARSHPTPAERTPATPRGPQPPQEIRRAPDGRTVRVDTTPDRTRWDVREADPLQHAATDLPLFKVVVDWTTIRIINATNLTRSWLYAVYSWVGACRWGRVKFEVAWKRSLWCYGTPKRAACVSLYWDDDTKDWYCGGANSGAGCGCGQTRLSRIVKILTLAGFACPRGFFPADGAGSVQHPDFVELKMETNADGR